MGGEGTGCIGLHDVSDGLIVSHNCEREQGVTYSVDTDGIGENEDTDKGQDPGLGTELSRDGFDSLDTWGISNSLSA